MRKIKIGIIGCASIAERFVIPSLLSSEKFDVIAIASRDKEKAERFARMFNSKAITGYENLLEIKDMEAVYIPLPIGMHYEWIKKSLEAGFHVLSEKSFTENYKQAKDLVATAKNKKLIVMENLMFQYHSQIDYVKGLLDKNEIGELKSLKSAFGYPLFNIENNFRYSNKLGGGALLDAGTYPIKAAQIFLGKKMNYLASVLSIDKKWQVDKYGEAMFYNDEGVVADVSFGMDNFYQNRIELWGSKGKIIFERAFTAGPGFSPRIILEKQDFYERYQLNPDNHFEKVVNIFYDSIFQGNSEEHFHNILTQSLNIQKLFDNSIRLYK